MIDLMKLEKCTEQEFGDIVGLLSDDEFKDLLNRISNQKIFFRLVSFWRHNLNDSYFDDFNNIIFRKIQGFSGYNDNKCPVCNKYQIVDDRETCVDCSH